MASLFDYIFKSDGDESHFGSDKGRVRKALWDENGDSSEKEKQRVIRNRALDAKAQAQDKVSWWKW